MCCTFASLPSTAKLVKIPANLPRSQGAMSSDRLNVIALISGGKDSFFSLLHCIHLGHRVVALANLFPAEDGSSTDIQVIDPESTQKTTKQQDGISLEGMDAEKDLNSFMYQTVGHEIIPLYAAATGLPLYRQPIRGDAVRHERDYDFSSEAGSADETESMSTLLRAVMERHPEANALCAGAILSTYQRTRVESVAVRLGLTPLAPLWKYPVLPCGDAPADDAQLLLDMAAAGLEARIIKVASAGLGQDHLWRRVTSLQGAEGVKAALRKFGAAKGAVLGEGGEFETLVVDGPQRLFKKRIVVQEGSSRVIHEGGGSSWLLLRGAESRDKRRETESESPEVEEGTQLSVRTPELLDAKFQAILTELLSETWSEEPRVPRYLSSSTVLGKSPKWPREGTQLLYWAVSVDKMAIADSIEGETTQIVDKIQDLLLKHSLEPHHILNTSIILRRMSDFPRVNAIYGQLFAKPNPPSRVTVCCGEHLHDGCSIAIFLTVDPLVSPGQTRQGLHVQSRSYWAPANIGPYSQAIGAPAVPNAGTSGLQTWSVAGQIPLIPSTMALPASSDASRQTQIVLSLQHLWRIGVDVKIQYWTSAVAFFARATSPGEMKRNVELAYQAWWLAHGRLEDQDDDDDGPDPWDLKYNPQYATHGADDPKRGGDRLPDWSVLSLHQQNEASHGIPPFFAIEVQELPRQSAVEWHAHLGLSQVEEGTVELVHHARVGNHGACAWHTLTRTDDAVHLHTIVAFELPIMDKYRSAGISGTDVENAWKDSLGRLDISIAESSPHVKPYLIYVDVYNAKYDPGTVDGAETTQGPPLLPCQSIWSQPHRQWGVVCLFRTLVQS